VNDFPDSADEDETAGPAGGGDCFVPSDHREPDSPRRTEEDRRQTDAAPQEEERRADESRRQPVDRRSMGLEVISKTTGSISNLEDWLDDNCDSDCQVVLQKVGMELEIKHLKVMFENETDRDIFLDRYLKVAK